MIQEGEERQIETLGCGTHRESRQLQAGKLSFSHCRQWHELNIAQHILRTMAVKQRSEELDQRNMFEGGEPEVRAEELQMVNASYLGTILILAM